MTVALARNYETEGQSLGPALLCEGYTGLPLTGGKPAGQVFGGTFQMGSECFYPAERPAHRVTIDGFWIDRHYILEREHIRWEEESAAPTEQPESYGTAIWTCDAAPTWLSGRRALLDAQ